MPKCPKCQAEIDHLGCFQTTELQGVYHADSGFSETMGGSIEMSQWECPACGARLNLGDEDDAIAFLEGKEPCLAGIYRDPGDLCQDCQYRWANRKESSTDEACPRW